MAKESVFPVFDANSAKIQEIVGRIKVLMQNKTITFVRHGESQAVLDDVYAGCGLDSPLTPKGEEEARKAAAILIDQKIKPSCIIASTLARAISTAAIIKASYDDTQRKTSQPFFQTDFVKIAKLSERDWKSWTGKPKGYEEGKMPEGFTGVYEKPESDMALATRILEGLEEALRLPNIGDKPLFASHTGVMSNLFHAICGIKLDKASFKTCAIFKIKNGKLFSFDKASDDFVEVSAKAKQTATSATAASAEALHNSREKDRSS